MKVVVDPKKCRGSERCIEACPERAIRLVDGVAVVDPARCDGDGICIPACPNDAIYVVEEEE